MSKPNANQAQQKVAIPDPLQPGENYADWHTCLRPDALIMAKNFAKLYRLKLEAGVASLLVTAAHSLGDSLQVALPHTNLSPPFNLLTVTAEPDPIWTEVPLKFLKTGIEDIVEAQLRIQQARAESKSDEKAEHAIHPEKRLQALSEAAGLQVLRRMVDTITCDNLRPPFVCPPIDRAVSLLTPPGGLLRTLATLTDLERLYLEESLQGARAPSLRESAPGRQANPSFMWQIPQAHAASLFRQHGNWLLRTPFVLLHSTQTSFPCLDKEAPVLRQFKTLSEVLFSERHSRYANPQVIRLDRKLGKPTMKFLDESATWLADTQDDCQLRWVADLGLKFSLTLMRLENEACLTERLVENGLELAKFYARQRLQLASVGGWSQGAENAETADLSIEERKAFLKICQAGKLTKAELRRFSHQMTASERDAIVTKLISLRLVKQEGKFLLRNAA